MPTAHLPVAMVTQGTIWSTFYSATRRWLVNYSCVTTRLFAGITIVAGTPYIFFFLSLCASVTSNDINACNSYNNCSLILLYKNKTSILGVWPYYARYTTEYIPSSGDQPSTQKLVCCMVMPIIRGPSTMKLTKQHKTKHQTTLLNIMPVI